MKKILLVILLITGILFGISAVAAGDLNDTAMTSEDVAEISNANDDLIESSDMEILGDDDDGTFTALQNKIKNAEKGAVITLDKDYTYNEGFSNRGITISKDLTINGNGHTINGLSKSRIFTVMFGVLANHKVVLNNIVFANGNTNRYGGAIFNYADLTLNDCVFTNNHAENCGGAVNSVGHLSCNNCIFNNNVADGDGGAILTLSIENNAKYFSNFYKNATPQGAMDFLKSLSLDNIINYGTDYIKNCAFNSNVAKGRGGGAIYGFTNLDIDSCAFNSNMAGENGGAVFGNMDLFIRNSDFYNNQVPMYGGAVYFKCHEQTSSYKNGKWISDIKYYSNSIESSTFTKNTAGKGGAIYGFRYSDSDNVHCAKAIKCTFTDNQASQGRDIYGGTTTQCVFNYLKLTLKTVKVKKSAKKLVLTATLKKGATPLKSKKVTFKFNGKTYKAKTNKKGVAKVTIKKKVLKKLKVGKKVKYQVSYGKLTVKKTATVKK